MDHVPQSLAANLQDGQEAEIVAVKKPDKKKNRMGWTAVAVTPGAG